MPTWLAPAKKTRSPGCSWLIETGAPIPNCAYELCGRETPICAKAYITRPEQSNPLGDAPPHTYGTPRYRIAIPTTPPWIDGGATVDPSGAPAPTPIGFEFGLLIRSRACAASCS